MGQKHPWSRHLLVCLIGLAALAEAHAGELTESRREALLASGFASSELLETVETDGWAPVLVSFAVPGVARRMPDRAVSAPDEQEAIASECEEILAILGAENFRLRHRYRSLNAFAGSINPEGLWRLFGRRQAVALELETGGTGQLVQAVPLANLDYLNALHLTGEGVTVAVLDTGIDTDHPDLVDDLVGERCFCSDLGNGCCPDGSTDQSGAGSAEDDHGHGTNVAGIVSSAGSVAPVGGAPDAAIVAVKVLDANNTFCCTEDLIKGLDYILNERPDVDLVNMSLATANAYSGDCDAASIAIRLITAKINSLRDNGILTFAASGDGGSGTLMPAPACISGAISVGAVYDSDVGPINVFDCSDASTAADQVACWSSSNASTDLLAPGAPITSTGLAGGTSTFLGTSQASPVAAACAAALLEADPNATPDEIEAALESSPTQVTDPKNGLAFPRVDCQASLAALPDPSVPLPGDGNGDGAVTGADYTIWANNFGAQGVPLFTQGDYNGDGTVSGADYTVWANNFGATLPATSSAPVPEPVLNAAAPSQPVPSLGPAGAALLTALMLMANLRRLGLAARHHS